jgi:hypothetical protein
MRKKVIISLITLFIFVDVIVIGYVINNVYNKPQKAHFHAGFQVYADGKLEDFTDEKYMNTTPCALRENTSKNETPEEIQMEKAHLHDNIGNVAHSHLTGGKWKDLFQNMKYDIASKGNINGYVNGVQVNNILDANIKPYDSAVIFVGDIPTESHSFLSKAVNKDVIIKAEKMSENCGS